MQLWHSRREAAKSLDGYEQHDAVLKGLGPNGMSSDEEEIVDGSVQYRILKKPWRAAELTPWLRVFDIIYLQQRLDSRSQGSLPQARIASDRVSDSRKVVKGLPSNAYNPTWLDRQSPLEKGRLRVGAQTYSFVHTPSVLL